MKPVWLCSTCDKTWIHGKPDNHQHPLTPMYSRESLIKELDNKISLVNIAEDTRKLNSPNDPFLHGHISGTKECLEIIKAELTAGEEKE